MIDCVTMTVTGKSIILDYHNGCKVKCKYETKDEAKGCFDFIAKVQARLLEADMYTPR